MREPRDRRLPWLVVSGVVVAHTIAYRLAVPNRPGRASLLAETGHSYWRVAVIAAFAGGVWSVVSEAARWFSSGWQGRRPTRRPALAGVPRLAGQQVALFLAVECFERLRAHEPLGTLLHGHLLPYGLAAQIVVACVLAVALRVLSGTARRVGAAARTRTWHARRTVSVLRSRPARLLLAGGVVSLTRVRGPPFVLVCR
jgi:hypothetical protein